MMLISCFVYRGREIDKWGEREKNRDRDRDKDRGDRPRDRDRDRDRYYSRNHGGPGRDWHNSPGSREFKERYYKFNNFLLYFFLVNLLMLSFSFL